MTNLLRQNYNRPAVSADDDTALVQACRNGDQVAWEKLVRRYQRLIYSIPRRAGLSDDHAAEVFHHVCCTLIEQLDKIEQPESISSWLAAVARRESLRQIFLARARILAD